MRRSKHQTDYLTLKTKLFLTLLKVIQYIRRFITHQKVTKQVCSSLYNCSPLQMLSILLTLWLVGAAFSY